MPDPIFGWLPCIWPAICDGTTEMEGGPHFKSIILLFLFDKCVFTRPEDSISYPNIWKLKISFIKINRNNRMQIDRYTCTHVFDIITFPHVLILNFFVKAIGLAIRSVHIFTEQFCDDQKVPQCQVWLYYFGWFW